MVVAYAARALGTPRAACEKNQSNEPKRGRFGYSFSEKLVQLLQEEPDVIRWTREGTIVIPDPAKLESRVFRSKPEVVRFLNVGQA